MTVPRVGRRRSAYARLALLVAIVLLGTVLSLTYGSNAASVTVLVPHSTVAVADTDLDGYPATGDWSGAVSVLVPLENADSAPYGSATLIAKHDGTYMYFRIDGSIDVSWVSAAGNRFWLGMQISPSGTSHHGGGSWDGTFFGLWDGTDYAPQPAYPPNPVDTNGFAKPPAKDASQDALGKLRTAGSVAPYTFTAEWKKKLNTGDASDLSYAADGTTLYNFFITTDSDGGGSSGGGISHKGMTNANTIRFAAPSASNTAPTVDLTTPDGGQIWSGGSSHTIRWNMSDAESAVTVLKAWINASSDGGATYAPIPGAQGLTGLTCPCTYSWTVPGGSTSQARVRVEVRDPQGLSAVDASLANFAIDGTPPSVTAFLPADGATGVSAGTQARATFSEAMNQASAQAAFSLRRVDTLAYVSGSFAWSGNDLVFTPAAALASGISYRAQVNATAKDTSDPGNSMAASQAATFTTADLTPPSVSGASALPSPQEAGGRVNVSASVTDNGIVSGVWVEVRDPGSVLLANATAGYDSGTLRYFYEAPYAHPGTYSYRISARDGAGNWNVAVGSFLIRDTVPPVIQHVPVTQAIRGSSIRITASVTDIDAVASAKVDYTDVLGSRSNGTMVLSGSVYVYDIPAQAQLGTLTYFLWSSDPSGNAARTPTYSVTVIGSDTQAPFLSALATIPPTQDATLSVNVSLTATDNVVLQTVTILVTDPSSAVLGNFSMLQLGASDTFYFERTYAGLGTYAVTVWATDGSGNAAFATGSFDIVDRLAPSFVSVSVTPAVVEAGQPVNLTAEVTDNVGIAAVTVEIRDPGGAVVGTAVLSGASGTYFAEATLRSLGNHSFVVTAQDASGNLGTYAGNFTVVDTAPPVAVAGADVSVWIGTAVVFDASASHDNSAILNYTWSFLVGGTTVALYGPVAGYTFGAAGVYDVTLTVLDAAGLQGTAQMTVTILTDTVPPLRPTLLSVAATAPGCLLVSWEAPAGSDAAGYRVFRWNETAQAFELVAEVPAAVDSYADCDLADNTTYSYWVLAFDAYGNLSPPSSIDNGRTPASLPPSEDLELIYQIVIGLLLVLVVVLATLRAGGTKRKGPPPSRQSPPGPRAR